MMRAKCVVLLDNFTKCLLSILLKKSQAGTYGWPDGSMRCANSIAIVESKSCLLDVVPRNGRLKPLQGRFVP